MAEDEGRSFIRCETACKSNKQSLSVEYTLTLINLRGTLSQAQVLQLQAFASIDDKSIFASLVYCPQLCVRNVMDPFIPESGVVDILFPILIEVVSEELIH